MPHLEGRTIAHYRIARTIGAGGMGEVYLGEDTRLDRFVAIKVLNKKYEQHEENVRRFIREAKAASALNHPNILTIFEIGDFEGSHYIVSEYVDGQTLRQALKQRNLELPEILDITSQIAGALAAAHKAKIIHRDIKPENVIVRDDGYVKVLDFGLAKLISDSEQEPAGSAKTAPHNTTASGIILGTVNYMSPEQAKGRKVDRRTDIFSLGAVLYEMITGKAPFAGDSMPETFANLMEREPEPMAAAVKGVPDEIERITLRMLEKEPEHRYGSMAEVTSELRALDGMPSGSRVARSQQRTGNNRTAAMQQTTGGGSSTTLENTGPFAILSPRWPVLVALCLLLVGSICAAGYFWWQGAVPSNEIRSVAVMPFVNETGDPQIEYLAEGMTDTLIGSLSELPNIKVKARTSVFRYKGKEIDPRAIGKELGVQAIVNARVTQRDGRTSVSLEVVDTETEDVIFSTRYDKPQGELVTLQNAIARDVSGKLKSKLSGAEEAKVTKTHTADPEALQLYLQGEFYRHKGGRSNALLATDFFSKAIEKDPNYALAYASLSSNYSSYFFYSIAPPIEFAPKAKAAALRAVELDDSLPEAHVALGQSGGDAEKEFLRAIELNPNYAEAHGSLCVFLRNEKRFDDAIAEGKKAQELDPLSAMVTSQLGSAYAYARRYDEAIEIFKRAHEIDPTLWVPLGWLGFPQTLKGQSDEAIATFRKAVELSDGSPNPKSHLAYALAKAGQRDEALKLVDELRREAEQEYVDSFNLAISYIALGDKDEAFVWLGRGVDQGSIDLAHLNGHPWLDDLRSDPRFDALLVRANRQK
jgi:serine/threonine-protein kinase